MKEKINKWISVKERLPKVWEAVLLFCKCKYDDSGYRKIVVCGYLSENKEFVVELPILKYKEGSDGIDRWGIQNA